jgi:putative hydrolase of the HAD superfamily
MDGLLIDYGGVLTGSVFASFAAFCAREGLPADTLKDAFLGDARPLLEGLEDGSLPLPEFERRLASLLDLDPEDLARRLMREARPDRAMREAVRRFHEQGVRTALVSNSWRPEDYAGLDAFDAVVLSQELGVRKPDARIYQVALERVALAAERCVFVDDLGGNLKMAKELGMTTVKHERAEITIAELERLLLPRPS